MEVKPGYKQTEVGVIPEDWEVSTVGEEFSIQLGKMLDSEKNTGILKPYIGNRSVQWGRFELDDIGHIKMTPADLQRFRLRYGDLLVCEGGEIGRAAIWREQIPECYYQKALHRLRPKRGYRADLLLWMLERWTSTGFLANFVTQTSIAHLPKDKFENVPIPIPPQAEQDAIAEVLSRADDIIETYKRLIAKKRLFKKGVMQKLLRPKDGWVKKRMGDIAEIRDGTHQTPKYVESGIPFFSVENVTRRDFVNTKFISEEEHRFLTRSFRIEKGDILMTRIGSIGDCKLIDWDVNASFYVSLALLKVRKEYSAAFICHYSETTSFKREIELNSLQSAIPKKINLGKIADVRVEMPLDLNEQNAIAVALSAMDTEIALLEAQLAKYRLLKKGLMQQLLTGRIRLI